MIFFGISKETLIYGLGMSQRATLNFDQIGPDVIVEQTGLEADSDVVADVVTVLEWLNDLIDELEDRGFTGRGADIVSPAPGLVQIHVEGSAGASVLANVNIWRHENGDVRVVVEREDSWEEDTVVRTDKTVPSAEIDEDAMILRDVFEENQVGQLEPITVNFAETIDTVLRVFDAIEAAEGQNAEQ